MSAITMDQMFELLSQARANRVTKENLQRFLLNPDGGTGYTVSVDFGKTVEEMVSGRYDWKNDDINDTNFKVCGGVGVVTVALELVHLNRSASSEEVLAHMGANGLRPANLAELLAFGATYPQVQREFPVVCLDKDGSSWVDPDGDRGVPCLGRDGSSRKIDLGWCDDDWHEYCRFLAVRKSA